MNAKQFLVVFFVPRGVCMWAVCVWELAVCEKILRKAMSPAFVRNVFPLFFVVISVSSHHQVGISAPSFFHRVPHSLHIARWTRALFSSHFPPTGLVSGSAHCQCYYSSIFRSTRGRFYREPFSQLFSSLASKAFSVVFGDCLGK